VSTGLRARRPSRAALLTLSLSGRCARFFVALALLAAALDCGAARAAASDDDQESVIVSATRFPTPAVEVASSITVTARFRGAP
jgi:outer membrane receptor protein involved in Fe transport